MVRSVSGVWCVERCDARQASLVSYSLCDARRLPYNILIVFLAAVVDAVAGLGWVLLK